MDEKVSRSVALEQAYVYDIYEQFYDNPKSKPWPKVQQFLERLEPGSIVCDVGCGNGKYFNINTSVFNLGGEKSIHLSELAREKENEVIVLDNLHLPYRDESLDAVLSIAVVHHLASNERRICALKELARVLRIGGRLIISVWAMEQSNRKFESQDVLVPCHIHKHLSSPSMELTSTPNTSEEDGMPPYHAYTQNSDTDSNRSVKFKYRRKGRSNPTANSSASSSTLSSPSESCYSFVRRAIQKLAGGRRVGLNRPWFLDSWSTCTKDVKKYENDPCKYCECKENNIQDLPIELRRIDDDDGPQRRQTFPSSQLVIDISNNLKSKSMTNIKTDDKNNDVEQEKTDTPNIKRTKPKLVKQKKSINEDDEEALDQPTEIKKIVNLNDVKVLRQQNKGGVLKQRSLNEEIMFSERIKEKEMLKKNIQKQTSLNEELIYHQGSSNSNNTTFESFRESIFSVSSSRRFQLIKTEFTNKLKNSTTNIERVTSASLKNGFVRIFQNWTSTDLSPTISCDNNIETDSNEEKKDEEVTTERRPSKEDSDSSKDSSLQSDTSVDSEDSFASVIYVPKSDSMSPTLSPGPLSPNIKLKQSSCPTSPKVKQVPVVQTSIINQKPPDLLVSPSNNNSSSTNNSSSNNNKIENNRDQKPNTSLAQKYLVPQIPKFKGTTTKSLDTKIKESRDERLITIKEILSKKKGLGVRSSRRHNFPIVRHSSISHGKPIVKTLPKLLSLELFNPETDDKDSESSGVSSPDSITSVIETNTSTKFHFPPTESSMTLLEAAADVANSLDEAVGKVIKSRSNTRAKKVQKDEVRSLIQRRYSFDTTPLLGPSSWSDDDCHKHLNDFADTLSEKLAREIDRTANPPSTSSSIENIDDAYIYRLSEELENLAKLSDEIQKQNEYLSKLSASDSLLSQCTECKAFKCKCSDRTDTKQICDNNNRVKNSSKIDKQLNIVDKDAFTTKLSVSKTCSKLEISADSWDSDKGSSTNSIPSKSDHSLSSNEQCSEEKDSNSLSRYSDEGSTASLTSCPEWKSLNNNNNKINNINNNKLSDNSRISKASSNTSLEGVSTKFKDKISLLSDASQDSLPSDNIGGEITYHRYYHVFKEGELDQLIEKYVENLHIISSYYDHASWCIIAEKVQVWTI